MLILINYQYYIHEIKCIKATLLGTTTNRECNITLRKSLFQGLRLDELGIKTLTHNIGRQNDVT